MIAGFTGTRRGMSINQKMNLAKRLRALKVTEFHHGDCKGADEQAHIIAYQMELKLVGHPPIDDSQRAFCLFDVEMVPEEYLDRNKKIVDACDILFVAPLTNMEEVRSGTWATCRYARSIKKPYEVLER